MTKQQKIYLAIGVAVIILGYGGFRGWRKYQGAQQLAFDIKDFGTPKMNGLTEAIFPLQVVAFNPTPESFTINHPTIKLYFDNGTQIATSLPRNEKLTIEKSGQTVFPIDVRIGLTDFGMLALNEGRQLIKNKSLKGLKVKFDVATAFYGIPINITGYEKQF